jgi:hypothetical protein
MRKRSRRRRLHHSPGQQLGNGRPARTGHARSATANGIPRCSRKAGEDWLSSSPPFRGGGEELRPSRKMGMKMAGQEGQGKKNHFPRYFVRECAADIQFPRADRALARFREWAGETLVRKPRRHPLCVRDRSGPSALSMTRLGFTIVCAIFGHSEYSVSPSITRSHHPGSGHSCSFWRGIALAGGGSVALCASCCHVGPPGARGNHNP